MWLPRTDQGQQKGTSRSTRRGVVGSSGIRLGQGKDDALPAVGNGEDLADTPNSTLTDKPRLKTTSTWWTFPTVPVAACSCGWMLVW